MSSMTRNKRRDRKSLAPTAACFRSALTNGSVLIDQVDGRSAYMRRYRDLVYAHTADLGGDDVLSEAQRCIIRRAALIQTQLERQETVFAQREDGVATARELADYERSSNALRRLLKTLGLHEGRKQRDATLDYDKLLEAARAGP